MTWVLLVAGYGVLVAALIVIDPVGRLVRRMYTEKVKS